MVAETRLFGTGDIAEDKILEFPMGLIGFENLKKFAIIYDSDCEERSKISWLQSMEEPALALPIIHPSEGSNHHQHGGQKSHPGDRGK